MMQVIGFTRTDLSASALVAILRSSRFSTSRVPRFFTITLNSAFDDNMGEMRAILTSVVLPDGTSLPTVISFDARKQ